MSPRRRWPALHPIGDKAQPEGHCRDDRQYRKYTHLAPSSRNESILNTTSSAETSVKSPTVQSGSGGGIALGLLRDETVSLLRRGGMLERDVERMLRDSEE